MADILHRVVINRDPGDVYKAITEHDGFSNWWTTDCEIGTKTGEISKFRFVDGSIGPDMKITELKPYERVGWQCVGGIDEWIGNELKFGIKPHERGSVLYFSQTGWKDATEFYMHCNCKWGFFLGVSLKNYLETGKGLPHPEDPDL